jgi:hypothetical protein
MHILVGTIAAHLTGYLSPKREQHFNPLTIIVPLLSPETAAIQSHANLNFLSMVIRIHILDIIIGLVRLLVLHLIKSCLLKIKKNRVHRGNIKIAP